MSKLIETVSILNSAIRTLIALVLVGGIAYGGWYGYRTYHARERAAEDAARELALVKSDLEKKNTVIQQKEKEIATLHVEVANKQKEIERLDTAMRLLKVDHRVARLTVLDQGPDSESGQLVTLIQFQELNEDGAPIGEPKQFKIPGDLIYIDAWVVKFDDKYVEEADIDRSTSLVLFRRVFGEHQRPLEGFALDEAGKRPAAYGSGEQLSDLERKIWSDFWSVANDERKQDELGIRAAHGEAPSMKVQKGKAYRVEIRASGGLSITSEGDAQLPAKPAA